MLVGNGQEKIKGCSLDLLSAIEKSIVTVNAGFLFGSCIENCYG